MQKITIVVAGLGALLLSTQAHAETQSASFEPALEQTLAEFPWDSGFIPSSGPIRLNLGASAHQTVNLTLPGDAVYDYDAAGMSFAGEESGGQFGNTIGAEITATVAIDVLGFETEVEVGLWGLEETVMGRFTPYVLDGNDDSPVEVAESIGPYNLVEQPVSVGPASGMLYIDWRLDVPGVAFQGTQIDLSRSEGSSNGVLASVTAENQVVPMALDDAEPGSTAMIYGTQYGVLDSEISLHLLPTLVLDIYGIEYEIGPFDLEVAYPLLEGQEVAFDQLAMEFDVPEAPPEDPEDDPEDPQDDPEDPQDDPEDPQDDDDPEDDDGDTDGGVPADGDGGGVADEGCGCTAGPSSPPAPMLALLGFAALGLRRRRRH